MAIRLPVAAVVGEEKRLAGAAGVLVTAAPPKLNPAEGVDATGAGAVPPKLKPPADGAAGVVAAEEGVPKENAPAVEAAGAAPNAGASDVVPPKLKVLEVAEEPNVGAAELAPNAGAADEEVAPNGAEVVAPNAGVDEPKAGVVVEAGPPKLNVLAVVEELKVGAAELEAPKAGGAEPVAGAAPPKLNVLEADDAPKAGAADVVLPKVAAGALVVPKAGVVAEAAPNIAGFELVAPNDGNAELAAGVEAAPPKLKVLGVAEEPKDGAAELVAPKAGIAELVAPKAGVANVVAPKAGVADVVAPKAGGANVVAPKAGVADVVAPKAGDEEVVAPKAGEADLAPKVAEEPAAPKVRVELPAPKAGRADVVVVGAGDPLKEKAPVEPRVEPEELDKVAAPNVDVEDAGAAVPKEKAVLLEAETGADPKRDVVGVEVVVVDGAVDEVPNENFEGPDDELKEAAKLGRAVVVAGVALPKVKPVAAGAGLEVARADVKENDGLGVSD